MTPFVQQIWWLLSAEGLAILFLCLPVHVPYRRTLVDWLANSSGGVLNRVRFAFGVVHALIALLWVDNFRRLQNLDAEIDVMKQANAALSREALFTLYSRRGRAQRDNHIMLFELYCAVVIYLLHLTVLRLGRYRNERNEYRSRYELLAKKHGEAVEPVGVNKVTGAKTAVSTSGTTKRK